jgi:hypothetical protein
MAMAYDFAHVERMAEIIVKADWINIPGQWRKLLDGGYEPVLIHDAAKLPVAGRAPVMPRPLRRP